MSKSTRRPMSRLPKPKRRGPAIPSYEYVRKNAGPAPEPDSWEKYQADLAASHDRAIAAYPDYLIIEAAEDLTRRNMADCDKSERIWIQARRAALLRTIQARSLTPAHRRAS